MAIIPSDEKVFMVNTSTNTTYSGSASLKAMQKWYTMQDIADSVGGGPDYLVYTALITTDSQTATAIVLENTIGNIVWTQELFYDATATLPGAFDTNKTWISATANPTAAWPENLSDIITATQLSNDSIRIWALNAGTTSITTLNNAYVEIRVYN